MLDVSLEIYKAIRALFVFLLPVGEEGSPTEIIMGHQKVSVKMPYLVISRPSYRNVGITPYVAPVQTHVIPGEGEAPDTYSFTESRMTTYRGRVNIAEIGGVGNMMTHVFSTLSDPDVRNLLYSLNLSITSIGEPIHMPQIQGNGYIDEFSTTMEFAFAIVHTIDTEIIETVEFINNVTVVPSL